MENYKDPGTRLQHTAGNDIKRSGNKKSGDVRFDMGRITAGKNPGKGDARGGKDYGNPAGRV